MPLTATREEIKAYQARIEKNKITSKDLRPCPLCNLDPVFFKIHAYRERRFLIIVAMLVEAVYCTLIRFVCTGCGKTFTFYPDFAIAYKHYTRQTVLEFSSAYFADDQKTYNDVIMTVDGAPAYSDEGRSLAPSTIYRWISTLADIFMAYQEAKARSLQRKPSSHFGKKQIPKKKYRTHRRKKCLLKCRDFLGLSPLERINVFSLSLQ